MEWYQKKRRRTLLDMHIDDWSDVFLAEFDPDVYFRALRAANVNAPMVYLQSHVGLCYWPTGSGRMHSGFIGRERAMNRLFDLCHGAGMDVIAYYSLIFNNWAYEQHPAWRMVDAYGNNSRSNGMRYGLVCPNNMEYRDFTARQIAEICDSFAFEGFFYDMTYWPMVCFCDSCKERWSREVGGELPTVIDWNDPRWMLLMQKREEWLSEFARFATGEVKRHKPCCSVEHQYSGSFRFWVRGNNENIAQASDYIGTDLYGGIEEQSFACKTWYNLTQNQPFQYMTSRCYPNLQEHTTTKTLDQLRTCAMLTYLHHGACLLIDAVDPSGTIDESVYRKMGEVYREIERYEPWLTRGEMRYDVGLYYNLEGKYDPEVDRIPLATPEAMSEKVPHLDALKGAALSLRSHHIPYGVVSNAHPEQLDGLKVLAVPDAPNLSHRDREAILAFVDRGGKLYLSGRTSPELVKEFFGADWRGMTDETITYIAPAGDFEPLNRECTAAHPLVMFERAVKLTGNARGTVLATLTLPYTRPSPHTIRSNQDVTLQVPRDDPRYPFSSIHSNPPGIATEYPAMLRAGYGKGEVIWSALPVERANRPQHSDLFAELITLLAGKEALCFSASAADSIECILFEDKAERQMIMRIINLQEGFHTMPAVDVEVCIRMEHKPKGVCLAPDSTPLAHRYEDGKLSVRFDRVDCYTVFVVQY